VSFDFTGLKVGLVLDKSTSMLFEIGSLKTAANNLRPAPFRWIS
jgi:hypothetical protein